MMATTPDEMTPDKAVRYACRALTEERERVEGTKRLAGPFAGPFLIACDERMANIDAAMRVLNGLVGR
jgi:hypothetical protein